MLEYGLEWHSLDSYFQFKEITAPGTPQDDHLRVYAKDKSSVSALYAKDDAGVEHELTNRVGGTGTAGRLVKWSGTSTIADFIPTAGSVLFAGTSGIGQEDNANFFWDDTNNRLGIGTASPQSKLDIRVAANAIGIREISTASMSAGEYIMLVSGGVDGTNGSADMRIYKDDASNTTSFAWSNWTGAAYTEKMRLIGSNGRLYVGINHNGSYHTGSDGLLDIENNSSNSILSINTHHASSNAYIFAHRSRGTHAAPTVVSSGDMVLGVLAKAYGGSSYHDMARIAMEVDGAPGNNDMPGRIVFSTTADASASLTERFRIGAAGQWGLSGATYGSSGDILSSAGSAAPPTWVTRATLNAALDHGTLAGLTDDDHTGYALLAGRSGGQTLKGGTASGDDLTLLSTSHSTKGSILLGTGSAYDQVNDFLGIGTAAPAYKFQVAGTITNNSASHSAAFIGGILNGNCGGAGNEMFSLWMASSFQPSASIGLAAGFRSDVDCSPGSGVTVGSFMGGRLIYYTGSGAGAITTTYGLNLQPVFGSIKPTTSYGLYIGDVGSTSITGAAALYLAKPTNATGNYYIVFDTADATDPTGTVQGRIPVVVGGVLRYLAYY